MTPILVGHDERLQSLRGLAALSVMVGHASLLLAPSHFSLIQGALFEQNSAVVFFYVLSGFVLAEALRRGQPARTFVIHRLGRLLPVFWASVFLGLCAATLMHHAPIEGASGWFNDNFLSISTKPRQIALNLLGISVTINGALWSIQTELAMAPVLLLLVPLSDGMSNVQNVVAVALVLILTDGALLPYGFAHVGARPFAYVYCFYLGLLIPRAVENGGARQLLQNGRACSAGVCLAALLHVLVMYGFFQASTKYTVDAVVSAQIVSYVISSAAGAPFFRAPLLVRLGDISYSFYAYGQIALTASAFAVFRLSGSPWWRGHPILFITGTLALALAVALPLAWFSHRWIEIPAIRASRALARSKSLRWGAALARTRV